MATLTAVRTTRRMFQGTDTTILRLASLKLFNNGIQVLSKKFLSLDFTKFGLLAEFSVADEAATVSVKRMPHLHKNILACCSAVRQQTSVVFSIEMYTSILHTGHFLLNEFIPTF